MVKKITLIPFRFERPLSFHCWVVRAGVGVNPSGLRASRMSAPLCGWEAPWRPPRWLLKAWP